jgi:glycopeptide antibiotics resistance protein
VHRSLEQAAHRRFRAAIGCAVWSAVIVAATAPWTDFVGHTHWQKVQWIPFRSPPVKLLDVVVNTLLYLPLGYTLASTFGSRGRVWRAVALAAALSLLVEWSQLYSHFRFPSVQDVICNVSGAWAGARLAARRTARPRRTRIGGTAV